MNAMVSVCGDQVRANSRDVATAFERRHCDVLRSIDNMIEQEPLSATHFCVTEFHQSGRQSRAHRSFDMDRDGFSLLAMGFNGPKALKWKLAYIAAFNAMEASLRGLASNDVADDDDDVEPVADGPCVPALLPDEIEAQRAKIQMVREARIGFGAAAGRRMWAMVGLPDLSDAGIPAAVGRSSIAIDHVAMPDVRQWIAARTEPAPNQKWAARGLYDDYLRWCRDTRREATTLTSFGKLLTRLGVGSHRSNYVFRIGLRLRPRSG